MDVILGTFLDTTTVNTVRRENGFVGDGDTNSLFYFYQYEYINDKRGTQEASILISIGVMSFLIVFFNLSQDFFVQRKYY